MLETEFLRRKQLWFKKKISICLLRIKDETYHKQKKKNLQVAHVLNEMKKQSWDRIKKNKGEDRRMERESLLLRDWHLSESVGSRGILEKRSRRMSNNQF